MKAITLNMRILPEERPEESMDVFIVTKREGSEMLGTTVVGFSKRNNEFNSYDSFKPRGGENIIDAITKAWCPLDELIAALEGGDPSGTV